MCGSTLYSQTMEYKAGHRHWEGGSQDSTTLRRLFWTSLAAQDTMVWTKILNLFDDFYNPALVITIHPCCSIVTAPAGKTGHTFRDGAQKTNRILHPHYRTLNLPRCNYSILTAGPAGCQNIWQRLRLIGCSHCTAHNFPSDLFDKVNWTINFWWM